MLACPAWAVLNGGMHRRKSYLLFAAVAGVMSLAEAAAVVLAAQVEWGTAGPLVVGLAVFALLLWTVLLATGLVVCAQHLLVAGLGEACSRLETTRMAAHIAVLSATPAIDLLGKALRRQEAPLGELRDSLLACAVAAKPGEAAASGARLARAAGLAAGVLRMHGDTLRMIAVLEDSVAAARLRQDEVRNCIGELRARMDSLPGPASAAEGAADTVFGYGVAAGAPEAADDPWADLPAALQERLRGSSPRESDGGEAGLDRN